MSKVISGEKSIVVKVSSFKNGLEIYENIQLIRIKSKEYTLLIMPDYLPSIGRIDGKITFISQEHEVFSQEMSGFFCSKANVFSLLIEE